MRQLPNFSKKTLSNPKLQQSMSKFQICRSWPTKTLCIPRRSTGTEKVCLEAKVAQSRSRILLYASVGLSAEVIWTLGLCLTWNLGCQAQTRQIGLKRQVWRHELLLPKDHYRLIEADNSKVYTMAVKHKSVISSICWQAKKGRRLLYLPEISFSRFVMIKS